MASSLYYSQFVALIFQKNGFFSLYYSNDRGDLSEEMDSTSEREQKMLNRVYFSPSILNQLK